MIKNCAAIVGSVHAIKELRGVVHTTVELHGTVHILKDHKTYEGTYNVIPSGKKQTLYTVEKVMKDNVTVESIPYYEVSNDSDGITAIIGGND